MTELQTRMVDSLSDLTASVGEAAQPVVSQAKDSLLRAGQVVSDNAPDQADVVDALRTATAVGGALGIGVLARLARLARTRPTLAGGGLVLALLAMAVVLHRRKNRRPSSSSTIVEAPEWMHTPESDLAEVVRV